jgi:hypothetical protein
MNFKDYDYFDKASRALLRGGVKRRDDPRSEKF